MKIVSLEAENYKRLKAVEITPDGDLVVVGGRNAQGKSSVLDAIWAALGGREGNKAAKPIRDGEESAKVRLDLGDMIVTRTWKGETSTVKVESKEGAVYKSPQALLDGLVGKLSFDPLAFTRLSAREQRDALLGMVKLDVDLDALATERQKLYDDRAEIGRQGKAIGDVSVDASLPEEETSASDIIAEIREAERNNDVRQKQIGHLADLDDEIGRVDAEIQRLTTRLKDLKDEHNELEGMISDDIIDTEPLESRLATIEETNAVIRANNEARDRKARQDKLRADYDALTGKLEALDKRKADALGKATFPVDGLGFDEHGVTFQGVPFSQASSAEQIRVSLAMAVAANPKLRVARIMDGSLLDDDNLKLIAEFAAEHDAQVWIEKVGTGGVGVIIEDGEVV